VNYDSIESAGEFDSREGASMASTTGTEELGTNQGRSTIGEDRQVVRGTGGQPTKIGKFVATPVTPEPVPTSANPPPNSSEKVTPRPL